MSSHKQTSIRRHPAKNEEVYAAISKYQFRLSRNKLK